MSARQLLERMIGAAQIGWPLDWRQFRDQIHDEHRKATTTAERELCLLAFKELMDLVEGHMANGPDIERFRATRSQDYNLLLVKEAMIGITDGNVRPHILAAITRREVAAGRMSEENELHKLAVAGETVMAKPKRSVFSRLFGGSR